MGVEVAIIAGAVAATAGAANSVVQGERARRQARRAGRRQAAAMRAEAAAERERGRRLAGAARARFGAANVGAAGTPLAVGAQNFIENVRVRERILAGARNAVSDADAQGDAFRLQGIGGGIQGAAQAASFASDPRLWTSASA